MEHRGTVHSTRETDMSKESKRIMGYIKNLSITNSGFEAVLNRIKVMGDERAERYLSKFHGMSLSDFMMSVGA